MFRVRGIDPHNETCVYGVMEQNPKHTLEARIKRIDAEVDKLQSERDEIVTALRVLNRYVVTNAPNVATTGGGTAISGKPRPDNIPTVWEMVDECLSNAEGHTLDVTEIVARIETRWWPGLIRSQIAPSIYKFAKEGRLVLKDRGVFSLPPKENEPPLGGSETGEVAASPKQSEHDDQGDMLSGYS